MSATKRCLSSQLLSEERRIEEAGNREKRNKGGSFTESAPLDEWFLELQQVRLCSIDPLRLIWLNVRDMLAGRNYKNRDLQGALQLAKTCSWPEAQRFMVFFDHIPASAEEAKAVLSQVFDKMAICFAGLMDEQDEDLIHRAAVLGDSFAQALMCDLTEGKGVFLLTEEEQIFGWAKVYVKSPTTTLASVIFQMGKSLVGHVDVGQKRLFGTKPYGSTCCADAIFVLCAFM